MSITLRARGIDLINLLIGKTSNFLLTAILFAMAASGMDAITFSVFGYWWSVGIMVGGVLLGGMSSAVVRTLVISATLRPALRACFGIMSGVLLIGLVVTVVSLGCGVESDQILLGSVVSAFGICVMLQAAIFGLLRALEASRSNLIASAVVLLLIPGLNWLLSGPHPGLPRLFGALATAFAFGTAACIVIAWPNLRHLFQSDAIVVYESRRVVRDALAFTGINMFSYAAVNVDFTLIKWLGTQDEFALLASGKVYFERFVLPALMVFAGAISLRVLRHANQSSGGLARIEARLSFLFVSLAFLVVATMATGYWVFSALIRHDPHQLAWPSAIAASTGYLLFAFNAVLLDVLVMRVRMRTVLTYVLGFVILGGAVEWLAFMILRLPGWALGWLAFNFAVTLLLWRTGLFTLGRRQTDS
jgi:hypothetical protein